MIKFGALVCAFVMSFTCFAACSGREKTVNDGKTVNVRVFLGGFGSEWIYELKDKFESAYEKEGYKINILTPANDNQSTVVVNELASKNSGVDLYFTEAVTIESVTHGDYGMLVEDLSEIVYDKSPIGFDGKEEEGTIREKIKVGVADNKNTYYNGKEYGFCWIASAGGLTVNMTKLNKYELDVPNTTDELIECFDAIYKGKTLSDGTTVAGSAVTGIYPHTFPGGNSGYPQMMYQTWLAQYMGLEEYGKFMSFTDDDGNYRLTDGYEAYHEDGLYEMLKVSYQVFDRTYATQGSTTQDADQANAKIMKKSSGAVFLANGNWMLNEVKLNYGEESKSLRFFKVPVISALGTKVFGSGTTANITDSKKCDEVLSKVVSYIDDNKTSEEIVSLLAAEGVTATVADVDRIVEARNMYFSRSFNENAYIAKDSQVKDIAALFLRMYASSDNAELFERTANAFTSTDSRTEVDNEYDFVKDTAKIVNRKDSIAFNGLKEVSGLRQEMSQGSLIVGVSYLANKIVQEEVTKYGSTTGTDAVYADAAKKLFDENYETAKSKWNEWLISAGYGQ